MENRPKYQNNQNNLIKVNSLIGNSYLSKCLDFSSLVKTSTNYWKGGKEGKESSKTTVPSKKIMKEYTIGDCSNSDFQANLNMESFYDKPSYENFYPKIERDDNFINDETLLLNPLNPKNEVMNMNYDAREYSVISDLNFTDLENEQPNNNFKLNIEDNEILNTNNYNHSLLGSPVTKLRNNNLINENTGIEDIEVENTFLKSNDFFANFNTEKNSFKNSYEINNSTYNMNSTFDNTVNNTIINNTEKAVFQKYESKCNDNSSNKLFEVKKNKTSNKNIKKSENNKKIIETCAKELSKIELVEKSSETIPCTINNNNININVHINNYNPQFLKRKLENFKNKNDKFDNFSIDFKSLKTSALIRLVKYYKFDFEKLSQLFYNTTPSEVEKLYKTIIGVSSYKVNSFTDIFKQNLDIDDLKNLSKNWLQKRTLVNDLSSKIRMNNMNNTSNTNNIKNSSNNLNRHSELLLNEHLTNQFHAPQTTNEKNLSISELQLVKSALSCSASGLCSTACETKRCSIDERYQNYDSRKDQAYSVSNLNKISSISKPVLSSRYNADETSMDNENAFDIDIAKNDFNFTVDNDIFEDFIPMNNLAIDNYNNCNNYNTKENFSTQKKFITSKSEINRIEIKTNKYTENKLENKSNEVFEKIKSNIDKESNINSSKKLISKSELINNANTLRAVMTATAEIANKLKDDYLPSLKNIDFTSLGIQEITKIGNLNSFLNESFAHASMSFQEISNLFPKDYDILSKYPNIVQKTIETGNSIKAMVKNLSVKYSKYNNIIITNLANTIYLFKLSLNKSIIDEPKPSETNLNTEKEKESVIVINPVNDRHENNEENNDLAKILNLQDDIPCLYDNGNLINDDQKSSNSSNIFICNNEDNNKNEADYTDEPNKILNLKSSLVSQAEEEAIYLNENLVNQSIKNTISCTIPTKKSPSLKFSISLTKKLEILSQMVHLLKLKLIWFQKIESLK